MKPKPFFLNSSFSLDDLAKMLGTNRTYMSRYVNEECGTNYDGLMRRLRIAYAVRMMHNHPEWPFKRIAQRSGFHSDTTFRKAFLEKYGMTPREYVQKNGQM